MSVFGVVYLIWNMVNGKRYVGQTVQPLNKRFNAHAHCKTMLIGKAIRKYGKENFRYGVIKSCVSKEEMDYLEKYFIAALKSKDKNIGYNCTDGGEGLTGWKHKPETIAKISAKNSGKSRPLEMKLKLSEIKSGANNPFYGKPRPQDVCFKVSVKKRFESTFKNLLREMDAHKLSYRGLARILGLSSHASVSRRMSGEYNFTCSEKENLSEFFGKPVEYLFQKDF